MKTRRICKKLWLGFQVEYSTQNEMAVQFLLPFVTSYLAESGFSSMIVQIIYLEINLVLV